MSFTLKVRTTGLWVYVPDIEPEEGNGNNQMTLLGIESRDLEPDLRHYSAFVLDPTYLSSECWHDSTVIGDKRLYPVEDLVARVEGANSDALEIVTGVADPCRSFPSTADEEADYRWLPRAGLVTGNGGAVQSPSLGHPKDAEDVAAKVVLTEGRFRCRFVGRDCEGKIILWRLNGLEQALAEEMELEVEIPGETVRLVADDGEGNNARWLELKPDEKGEAIVLLKNVPQRELTGSQPALTDTCTYQSIPHFHHLGRLFKTGHGHFSDPRYSASTSPGQPSVTFNQCTSGGPAGVNNPQCPGTSGDPSGGG